MHVGANSDDGSTLDAAALPDIIAQIRAAGYGFTTLDLLLLSRAFSANPRDNGGYRSEEVTTMRWLNIFTSSRTTHLRRAGGAPSHGVGHNPAMPHLAAAQIPGPSAGRLLAGENGTIPNDAADPVEKQGHVEKQSRPEKQGRRGRRSNRNP